MRLLSRRRLLLYSENYTFQEVWQEGDPLIGGINNNFELLGSILSSIEVDEIDSVENLIFTELN